LVRPPPPNPIKELRIHNCIPSVRSIATLELPRSFSRIHQLPQLETIHLTFCPAYCYWLDSDSEGRLVLQASILRALAASFGFCAPSKLTSLSLHNLCPWSLAPLEAPPFQTVLKALQCFQLSVLYDWSPGLGKYTAWAHFWGTQCCRLVLAPMQPPLTKLTLYSDQPVGAAFGFSFAGLYFPQLCKLSLSGFIFEPSVRAQHFILRHAATLARLELIACKLPMYANAFPDFCSTLRDDKYKSSLMPITWGHIWDRFAAELTRNRCCSIGGGTRRILRGRGRRLPPPKAQIRLGDST
jgi:hypothetical protein